jgi:hypothetical protein
MKRDEHFIFEPRLREPIVAARKIYRFNRHDPCFVETWKLFVMRIGTTLLFATVLAVGAISSLPRLCAEGPDGGIATDPRDGSNCADRYNAILGQAKASLVKGDRGAAINSLIAAKTQLRTCQEQEERNSTVAVAIALNTAHPDRTP